MPPSDDRANAGFTLIEALVLIALTGLIMTMLAAVTRDWLPNWKRGLRYAQESEKVSIVLERLVADLSAAQFITPNRLIRNPLFRGDEQSVAFVRSTLSPNGRRGLEIVQIAELTDSRGRALVRSTSPFRILPNGDLSGDQIKFADPVVLLRAPFSVRFSYASPEGRWFRAWYNLGILPSAVRVTVSNSDNGRGQQISAAARIHVDMMAPITDPVDDDTPTKAAATAAQLR
uniref:PulJ/GspJ family protein n=1 Tax=Bradyrhizobium sp. (strain ORS 278) TaxID=114615 RepID=UPI0002F25555